MDMVRGSDDDSGDALSARLPAAGLATSSAGVGDTSGSANDGPSWLDLPTVDQAGLFSTARDASTYVAATHSRRHFNLLTSERPEHPRKKRTHGCGRVTTRVFPTHSFTPLIRRHGSKRCGCCVCSAAGLVFTFCTKAMANIPKECEDSNKSARNSFKKKQRVPGH